MTDQSLIQLVPKTIQLTAEAYGASQGISLNLRVNPALPARIVKAEILALANCPDPAEQVELWLGPGLQKKLWDDVALLRQGVEDQAVLWLKPKQVAEPPTPQERHAVDQVRAALDQLFDRRLLHDSSHAVLHWDVLCVISAVLQGLVGAGKLQPWLQEGSLHPEEIIRPEKDLLIYVDEEADREFGPGHFIYGYFFHVGDDPGAFPLGNKRKYSYYRLDATPWLRDPHESA